MAKIITENFRVQTTNELYRSFTEGNASIVNEFESDINDWINSGGITIDNADRTALFDYFPDALLDIMNASQPDSTYYIMASSYTKGETITNTQFQKREFMRRVIFGNKVTQTDIRYMFKLNPWTSGVTYDSYDDNADISTLNMYVTVLDGTINEGSYKVFKCLRNNNGNPSTVSPSSQDLDTQYETITSDGYVWKKLFEVPPSEYLVYSTVDSLPYYKEQAIIDAGIENLSDIVIEQTQASMFLDYNLRSLQVQQITPLTGNQYEIELLSTSTAVPVKTTPNAYTNMYLRFSGGEIFDVIASAPPSVSNSASANRIFITVEYSGADLAILFPKNTDCQMVPKIKISSTPGTQALAWGVVDTSGTLVDIEFSEKGSEYKYATAKVLMPPALADRADENELRVILSPRGGHGSDPISELYMSKLSVITNFFADPLNNIPGQGTYTRVGLVKNPVFRDGTAPDTFDNRMKVYIDGDLSGESITGYIVEQTNGDDTVYATIHEVEYDSIGDETTLYLVDYIGDYASEFVAGDVEIKQTITSIVSDTYAINTVSESDKGLYTNYSGDLLHYVDFDAIARQEGRREKIKFVFDF
jgi:hypothetical protein